MKIRARLALVAASGLAVVSAATVIATSAGAVSGPSEKVSTTGSDTGNCVSHPCATINYAISQATPGETINVAPGTYHQTVDINKSVNIAGAGATKTTLDGSNLDPAGARYGIVFVGNAGGVVTVQGFTITNPAPYAYTGGEPMAIALADHNAGDLVSILNNKIVEGSTDTGASTDFPIGIDSLFNAATTTIAGNTISGFFQGSLLEDNGPASVNANKFTNMITGTDTSSSTVYPAEGLFFLADAGGTYSGQNATKNTFSGYSGYGIAEDAGYTGGYVTPTCVANGSIVTQLKGNQFALTGGQPADGISLTADGTGNDLSGSVENEGGYVTAPSNAVKIRAIAAPPTPNGVNCSPYSPSNGGGGTLNLTENNVGISIHSNIAAGTSLSRAGSLGGLHVPRRPRH